MAAITHSHREGAMYHIITIDGPAGSGKSTISRLLAKKINFTYLDTGAMYRAVALAAKRTGIPLNDGKALGTLCPSLHLHFEAGNDSPRLFLNGEDVSTAIRSPEMDIAASNVSAVREVREAMTGLQRKMAQLGDMVAEGRDMGTVVFPNAYRKFFLTASVEARAGRRYKERLDRGESISLEIVIEDLIKRDAQDEKRVLAPLRPAQDAVVIDSTELAVDRVLETILNHIKELRD